MVLADGSFDPLHVGHIRYLQKAASLGSTLCVRVAPDEAIRAKGREPFQTQLERAETLAAIRGVDDVRLGTLVEAIRDLKPRILVKGRDWRGKLPRVVVQACQDVGAEIVFTDTQTRTSTERLAG